LEGIVYELSAVIGLDGFYGEAELCGDIVAKISDVGCNLIFANKRKSPTIVGKIIEQNEVIPRTRNTCNRGCPHVTMNKFKRHGAK
jgi:hypothetical protein